MTMFLDLPVELILDIGALLTTSSSAIPTFRSLNALAQTCTALHIALSPVLYKACVENRVTEEWTLVYAVEHELDGSLARLADAGASLDLEVASTSESISLIHYAASRGSPTIVRKLLEIHPDGESWGRRRSAGGTGKTPLDYAAIHGQMEVVRMLAAIPAPNGGGCETQEKYLGRALCAAANHGIVEAVGYFLTLNDANIEYQDHSAGTPLCEAIRGHQLSAVRALLDAGANANSRDEEQHSPLHVAVENVAGDDIVSALLDGGADINAVNSTQSTPLHHALRQQVSVARAVEVVRLTHLLLHRGADPTAVNNLGQTPLFLACAAGKGRSVSRLVELLLEFGAGETVERRDYGEGPKPSRNPVLIALTMANAPVLQEMMPYIVDPELKTTVEGWLKLRNRSKSELSTPP